MVRIQIKKVNSLVELSTSASDILIVDNKETELKKTHDHLYMLRESCIKSPFECKIAGDGGPLTFPWNNTDIPEATPLFRVSISFLTPVSIPALKESLEGIGFTPNADEFVTIKIETEFQNGKKRLTEISVGLNTIFKADQNAEVVTINISGTPGTATTTYNAPRPDCIMNLVNICNAFIGSILIVRENQELLAFMQSMYSFIDLRDIKKIISDFKTPDPLKELSRDLSSILSVSVTLALPQDSSDVLSVTMGTGFPTPLMEMTDGTGMMILILLYTKLGIYRGKSVSMLVMKHPEKIIPEKFLIPFFNFISSLKIQCVCTSLNPLLVKCFYSNRHKVLK